MLFMPFYEVFISIFNCDSDGIHYLFKDFIPPLLIQISQINTDFVQILLNFSSFEELEDLVFYFVDELLPDQTPESVHLMVQG
jgi:hypothetical protein